MNNYGYLASGYSKQYRPGRLGPTPSLAPPCLVFFSYVRHFERRYTKSPLLNIATGRQRPFSVSLSCRANHHFFIFSRVPWMVIYSTNISFDRVGVRPITSSLGLTESLSWYRYICGSPSMLVQAPLCVCVCVFIIATSYLYYHFTVFTCSLVRLVGFPKCTLSCPPFECPLCCCSCCCCSCCRCCCCFSVSLVCSLFLPSFHPFYRFHLSSPVLGPLFFASLLSLCAAQTCFATKRHCFGNLVWLHTECKWDQKKRRARKGTSTSS